MGLFNEAKGGIQVPIYTVAELTTLGVPAIADGFTPVVMCSNGAAGGEILAFSDGTNWLRSDTGGVVTT